MDEAEKMDLVLNSDFDASLLDCWDSNATGKNDTKESGDTSMSHSPRSNHSTGGGVSWDSNSGFARLPPFATDVDGKSGDGVVAPAAAVVALGNNQATAAASNHQWQMIHQKTQQMQHTAQSPNSNDARKTSPIPVSTATSVTSKESRPPQNKISTQILMLGLTTNKQGSKAPMSSGMEVSTNLQSNQSTSSLPTSDASNTTQMHPLAIPSSANCPPHVVNATHQVAHPQMQTVAGMQNALFPMALTALGGGPAAAAFAAAGLSLSTTHLNAPNQQNNRNLQQPQLQQHLQQQTQQQTQQLHATPLFFQSQSMGLQANPQQSNSNANLQTQQQQLQTQPQQGQDNSSGNKTNSQSTSPPPFYLFDAPVELRVNFMQSQRMHGLPVTEDSNSYHYGVAVNGFHPQLNAQLNPATAAMANSSGGASMSSGGSQNHPSSVQLVDARHTNRKAGRIKNEREQRRAQKITELIDQLREKMETGGWKVEVKSKFHTLSSCADYVKHLIKVTREKEEAVTKAKSDLQMKERKVEEEKALQESRSDPESVMSSLTSSTGNSSNNHHTAKKVSSENSSSEEGQRKRKSSSDGTSSNKKRKSNSGHSGSSESSGEEPLRLNQQSLDKTTSSVSDITDSNKGSSNSGSDTQNSNQRSDDDDDASGTPSSISASSSAAVVGRDVKKHRTKHADVVIKERSGDRQHKFPTEVTSLEESFVLDYEEVFVKSNVPQIIATTAGRIIAWNGFFLKATGISKAGVKGLTIFSLVKQEKLSNLFEIVARALRKDSSALSTEQLSESSSTCVESQKWDYAGMTLPCIDFPSSKERPTCGKGLVNPLYITVTLMADEDPRKRLFHCVFTDCPGTNGALGSITPELLSMLFTRHRKIEADSRKSDKAKKCY